MSLTKIDNTLKVPAAQLSTDQRLVLKKSVRFDASVVDPTTNSKQFRAMVRARRSNMRNIQSPIPIKRTTSVFSGLYDIINQEDNPRNSYYETRVFQNITFDGMRMHFTNLKQYNT